MQIKEKIEIFCYIFNGLICLKYWFTRIFLKFELLQKKQNKITGIFYETLWKSSSHICEEMFQPYRNFPEGSEYVLSLTFLRLLKQRMYLLLAMKININDYKNAWRV